MSIDAETLADVVQLSERLKIELRHSWLSNGRQESVAEHTWQMAFLALVTHAKLEHPVDIDRALRMILVHDLAEAETGDIPYFETGPRKQQKVAAEQAAMTRIKTLLGDGAGDEVVDLFQEYEAGETPEAKFVKALDSLEVQMQHNLADISTWQDVEYALVFTKMDRHCAHDRFLLAMCEAVKADAEWKMSRAGIDVAAVRSAAKLKS